MARSLKQQGKISAYDVLRLVGRHRALTWANFVTALVENQVIESPDAEIDIRWRDAFRSACHVRPGAILRRKPNPLERVK